MILRGDFEWLHRHIFHALHQTQSRAIALNVNRAATTTVSYSSNWLKATKNFLYDYNLNICSHRSSSTPLYNNIYHHLLLLPKWLSITCLFCHLRIISDNSVFSIVRGRHVALADVQPRPFLTWLASLPAGDCDDSICSSYRCSLPALCWQP